MVSSKVRDAQKGESLAAVYTAQASGSATATGKAPRKVAKKKGGGGGGRGGGTGLATAIRPGVRASAPRKRTAEAAATSAPNGPFLANASLTTAERKTLLAGIERVLEGVFTHLPLKRARYGFDPIQRLRILRSQLDDLSADDFHAELADIVTRLRDAHTRYIGPSELSGRVAVLPFLIDMAGTATSPTYVVTHVSAGVPAEFKPGVIIDLWNGVPIDRAVQRVSEREVGGRPDTLRAWAIQSMTIRALQFGPPPDEIWVEVTYHTPGSTAKKNLRFDWKIVNPDDVFASKPGLFAERGAPVRRRERAVNPAAEAARRAKVLLFASHVIEGQQAAVPARAPGASPGKNDQAAAPTIIPTGIAETLKAMSIPGPGGPYGYLRIYAFDSDPESFIGELLNVVPKLPDRGLIIDVRGNPGGYIVAAERALQLFTPNRIEPTKFSVLATEFTRAMANSSGSLKAELAPWKSSLDAAVRNGELYAQPIPITDPEDCNDLGQHYGGPVLLVADATTYSAGDLFTAGFVDNAIGPYLCVGSATGAGGANVWTYRALKSRVAGTDAALPALPDGTDLSFAFRRATRSGPSDGIPIEDVGIAGEAYAMTYDDLMKDRPDLIARCIETLKRQPFSRLETAVDPAARTITVSTTGLDQLDVELDGKQESSRPVTDAKTTVVSYPAGTKAIELVGLGKGTVRQRRRLSV